MTAQYHNPEVQSDRPGFCVIDQRGRFACEPKDGTGDELMVLGLYVGWCGPKGKVRVWASLASAISAAERLHGRVTTVPRFNGYCLEWREVT